MRELKQYVEEQARINSTSTEAFKALIWRAILPTSLNYYITSKKTGGCIKGSRTITGLLQRELNGRGVSSANYKQLCRSMHIWSESNFWGSRIGTNTTAWLADVSENRCKLVLPATSGEGDGAALPEEACMYALGLEPKATVWNVPISLPGIYLPSVAVESIYDEAVLRTINAVNIIRSKVPILEEYCGGNLHIALRSRSGNSLVAYPVCGLPKHVALFGNNNLITRKITL